MRPYDFGFVGEMSVLMNAHPLIGPALAELFMQVMFAPGALTRPEREMVAAVAAAAQDCNYWTQSHAEFLRAEGGNGELIEAIKERRWRELPHLAPRDRALCAIAEKLSANAPRVTVTDWEVLRALGFDEMGCLEVAHIVGIFNYLTRLADGFGLELHPILLEAARSGIPLRRVGG
jgi:uncharacterized peroxidase-related enzyme